MSNELQQRYQLLHGESEAARGELARIKQSGKPAVIVAACMVGVRCRFDGRDKALPEVVARHTGEGSGWKSSVWMILLAMLQVGPLMGAFPVACLMWKKGTSPRNIFIYLGAFCTLKLPMLGFEIGFLGLKFTLLRTALSVPVLVMIAIAMDKMFGKDFVINDVSGGKGPKAAAGSVGAKG